MRAMTIVLMMLGSGVVFAVEPTVKSDDPVDRLIDALAESRKSEADKLDALFFATRGRLATRQEIWQAKQKYGNKMTRDAMKELSQPTFSPSDFRNAIYSHRLPPGAILVYDYLAPFGGGIPKGYYVPFGYAPPATYPGFIPNPEMFPLTPWIPPGTTTPLPPPGTPRSPIAKP